MATIRHRDDPRGADGSSVTAGSTGIARWRSSYRDSLQCALRCGGRVGVETAPIRGWCNRQHDRFWSCNWGFDSSPPSAAVDLPRSSSGPGRQVLILVTRVQIPYGVPCGPSNTARATFLFRTLSRRAWSRWARITTTSCAHIYTRRHRRDVVARASSRRSQATRCRSLRDADLVVAHDQRARQTDE